MAYSILAEISRKLPEQCHSITGFMFIAFDCAVFEKELDDERLEYYAVNLTSGARLTLERRRNPITQATVERLVRKLRDSKIAGLGRLEITNEQAVPLSKQKRYWPNYSAKYCRSMGSQSVRVK